MNEVNDIFHDQRNYLMAMAQWPLASASSPIILKVFAKFYELFMIFLPLHLAILHFVTIYQRWGESIDSISDFITTAIILSFCCFGTVFFVLHGKEMVNLVQFMNTNFRQRSAKGLTFISIEQSHKRARLFSNIWIICCVFATILWGLYPLLIRERVLPLRCWYPFDVKKPVVYEVVYFLQFLAQVQIGLVYGNGSATYIALIILICGQYDILFCSMKNIINTANYSIDGNLEQLRSLQRNIAYKDEELNQYYCSREELEDFSDTKAVGDLGRLKCIKAALNTAIKDCMNHHHAILNVCSAMEKFYNPYCLVKSLQITFQLCFLLFISVNQTSSTILRNIHLVQYISLTGTELLLFSYFGETLRIQSLRVGEALMRSAWVEHSVMLRKDMMIILPNALRPVTLTAGKFYPMDVQRLKSVVASAFSFFTLLQNMKAKGNL